MLEQGHGKHSPFIINISIIIFLFAIPVAMLLPMDGQQSFKDTEGYWFITGITLCLIILAVTYFFDSKLPIKLSNTLFLVFTGLALILFGFWVYGEKTRFEKLPVIQTEAAITHLDSDSRMRHEGYFITYAFIDANGTARLGKDTVNDGTTWMQLKIGNTIRINYLKSDPSVSRIIERSNMQQSIFKAIFIVIGGLLSVWPIYNYYRNNSRKVI